MLTLTEGSDACHSPKLEKDGEKQKEKREDRRETSSLFTITSYLNYGGVAQLGEHLPCKQGVMGSNPIISTKEAERFRRSLDRFLNEMTD